MARLSFNVNLNEVYAYRKTKLIALIDEFIDSNADVAEFLFAETEYKSASSCVTSILNNLKKRNITSVKVIQRKGRVFLVREGA
jgi:hypothetical protein